MIYTVFTMAASHPTAWQAELLEYSWGKVRQPGELVRLVPSSPNETLPRHRLARVVETIPWSPHPYTGDTFAGYDMAASVLEWIFRERIEGTILLLEPDCVFRRAITSEVALGQARATAWPKLPRAETGPFGLGEPYVPLEQYCVNRSLDVQAIARPLLIDARDLRRLAPRWLELMGLLRSKGLRRELNQPGEADLAYALAAAEAYVPHEVAPLGVETDSEGEDGAILRTRVPVESERGEILWDDHVYTPWGPVGDVQPATDVGREVLALLNEFVELREAGGELAFVRPMRRRGVREGRVLDQMQLEIPGRSDTLSLNPSASAIWGLCDGHTSLAELTRALEGRFDMTPGTLREDVRSVVEELERVGALELGPA